MRPLVYQAGRRGELSGGFPNVSNCGSKPRARSSERFLRLEYSGPRRVSSLDPGECSAALAEGDPQTENASRLRRRPDPEMMDPCPACRDRRAMTLATLLSDLGFNLMGIPSARCRP